MVNYSSVKQHANIVGTDTLEKEVDRVFAALAHATRRKILERLREQEYTVGELAADFPISAPAMTKHLNQLERAGLIRRRKDGRVHHCRLQAAPLADAAGWLEQYRMFWHGNLNALDVYLRQEYGPHTPPGDEPTEAVDAIAHDKPGADQTCENRGKTGDST